MEIIEIILIVLGIAAVILSFTIAEKKEDSTTESSGAIGGIDKAALENTTKEVLASMKNQLQDVADDIIGKTERELGSVSIEKNKALYEESESILKGLEDKRKEIQNLHDMLDARKKEIESGNQETKIVHESNKDVVARLELEINKANELIEDFMVAKDVAMMMDQQIRMAREIANELKTLQEQPAKKAVKAPKVEPVKEETSVPEEKVEKVEEPVKEVVPKEAAVKKTRGRKSTKSKNLVARAESILKEDENNNNRKILELHNEGKSDLEIAKALSLGIGEVRLVVDLFKGAQ